jgi:amino acid adenylation domain-containing protein
MRAVLARTGPQRHELVLTGHHIVCDGWSFGVLATELMQLYGGIVSGAGADTLPFAESFGDYALAQTDAAHVDAVEADTRWWVSQYDGAIPVLELPLDRPRQALRGFASRREDLVIDAALSEAVRKLGGQQGTSLFVTLFSVFGALMARLSGQDDVVVGVPAAGQAAEGQHALVGHCVQLLPIRMSADLNQPFNKLMAATRSQVLDAYEHQSCTFGRLLQKLQLQRDPSRLPLVSVLFNVDQAIDSKDLSQGGLNARLHSNPRHFENFELFLNASQTGGEIVLECQYNTDLFDAATVRRWLSLYREALARLVADAAQPVVKVLAPTADDLALLAQFNRTDASYERDTRIDALISRQAAATPDAIAIVAGSRQLSYRELDQRANALANELQTKGVRAGDLVGLYCGRNEHMLVGLLGILKAGAGYVPMDPSFPADRLGYMSDDAQARCIVTDHSVGGTWIFPSAQPLYADELTASPTAPTQAPASTGSAQDVAYVIYTSGSTGKPKGVRVPHRTVANLLASVTREPGMTASNVVLSVTTLSFDIAVSETILPLTVGARIVVADRAQSTDGDRLRELIERERVDFIDATPSTWRLLMAAGWQGGAHFKVICTGEPLPVDLGRELLPRVGELWNGYGPTETTVWSSFYRVNAVNGPLPIGRPVANTQIHVVDEQGRQLPVGVVGELFIGGDGVTLGYLGRPDLTAERFLPDPYRPGHNWYKTGDLGRWRADGVLECLGRSDHQVKVRGYRIELGEIEASLGQHADVDRAVVITREDDPGDVRLVAYVVSGGPVLNETALRDHLRRALPEYMIPAHVMQLSAIPLLPNGKINRNALPRPERVVSADRLAARTPMEAQVLTAMEQVLNLPGIGIRDDFFALGGHSLLAAKLTARLNKELGLVLPLRTVFESPTAEGLARAVEAAGQSGTPRQQPIARRADQSEAPLTVMQERIRFMERMYPGRVVYNTPSAHRLSGPFSREAFEKALAHMVQRQPSLRTFIVDVQADAQGTPVQRVADHIEVNLPFEDLSAVPEAEREAELMKRLQAIVDQPMDIGQAPLFKMALYRMAPEQHVFLFMPHHIIWDGWSFDLLYEEMAALYPAALEGRVTTLPAPPVSYVDYAHWHQQWMGSEACQTQIDHWKRRFASIKPPSALPTDRPRRAGMTGLGAVEWVHVDKALTERLRQIGQDQGITLNMLVMAVYAAMLSEALSSPSLVMGVPVRGRASSEVESVMGFFNNLLPVHVNVDAGVPLLSWFASIKRELLDAMAHQDVPFERLAAEPEIAVHANKVGLYQSLYSFQDARARERHWGPLAHSSVLVMQKGATEDFGLWIMEVPGGLEGGINYNADLFDARTAQIFKERIIGLLRRVADAPGQTVSALLKQSGADATAFADWVRAHQETKPAQTPTPPTGAAKANAPVGLNDREARLAEIWASLLGIDAQHIHAQDNFFDLGGSSLLVMQAVTLAERQMGLKVDPSRYVYESLARLVIGEQGARSSGTSDTSAGAAQAMARIWADLLGVDPAQIHPGDNFFDLGGSSLLVMRAVAETEKQLGLKIDPSRYVYESLQQLSTGAVSEPALAATAEVGADNRASTAPGGLLSRVLGRFGRKS